MHFQVFTKQNKFEPGCDETNKMTQMQPQINLGVRPFWSGFAVRLQKVRVITYT